MSIQRSNSVLRSSIKGNKTELAVMIEGSTLAVAFDQDLSGKVMKLFDKATSIIVYRSSPDQKAQTITNVMNHEPNAFTLAVGDGANDVNMIQTASIGVGIMGKEGT